MASNSSLCGICAFRNISIESMFWCSECDEGLCTDCQEQHDVSKSSRNHNTIPIADYHNLPTEILKISEYCTRHNERYQMFCKRHDIPCCRDCVIEEHNKCEHLAKIDDVTHNVKLSYAFLDMEGMLDHVAENLKKVCKNRQENLLNIQEQKVNIEKEIKITREKINNHLDKIQDKLMNDLKVAEKQENKSTKNLLKSVEERGEKLNLFRTNIEKIKQHASNLQIFLVMKEMQSDIALTEEFIESVVENEATYQTVISNDLNPKLLNIPSKVAKFGDININRKPCQLSLVRHKANEAQMMITQLPSTDIGHLTLQLEQTVTTNMSLVKGCTMLQDGRMVFSSYSPNGELLVMKDGSVDFKINPEFQFFDIVKMKDDNVIAATSGYQTKISIIDINNRKVIKTFDVEKNNYGITIKDNTLLYCIHRKGIQQLNLTTTSITDIVKCPLSYDPYITTFGDNIYYTNPYNVNTVTCCDLHGTKKWEFNDRSVLCSPRGISVDQNGNVYVAGFNSHNVIVLSPDGKHYQEILSKKDGLNRPIVLYYDHSINKLLVSNNNNGKAFLFRVT